MENKACSIIMFLLSGLCLIVLFTDCKNTIDNSVPNEQMTEGEQLYMLNCAQCHMGASPEAPRIESLKLLSPSAIVKTLNTGVMKNQASTLSKDQRSLIADYISEVEELDEIKIAQNGMCSEGGMVSDQKVKISNWGFDLKNTRFQHDDGISINANNVGSLKLDWAFAFPGATRARVQVTIAGNTIYTASQHGTIYALDKETGCILWTYQADAEVRSALTIQSDEAGKAERLYFGDFAATVYAFDLRTKKVLWKRKIDDHQAATITGSLNLFEDRLYIPVSSMEIQNAANPNYKCCTFRGAVVALEASTGALVWKQHTIEEAPHEQGVNRAGNPVFAPSGAPVWTSPTIDQERRLLYVGTGENYSRPSSQTSDAIIAMSLEDGAIQWVQQTVFKDAWNSACMIPGSPNCPDVVGPDYDFGAPAILLKRKGAKDLILAGQKSGMIYAIDPDNQGAIVWKKRMSRGGMMGGIHWGMATDGEKLYVPIDDESVYPEDADKAAKPGVHAVDVDNGDMIWSVVEEDRCGDVDWVCYPGISAAITITSELVFAGALDGMLKAYSTKDGKELWAYDTNRDFDSVNGVKAFGGTIDSDGPVLNGQQLFINSGYAKFGEKAGNVLLAFSL